MGIFFQNKRVNRIEERQSTFGYVEVRSEAGVPLTQATLRNKSRFGAMIRPSTNRSVPERVNLWFPKEQVDVNASVRWTDNGDFGVKFDHEMGCLLENTYRRDRVDVVTTHLERAGI